MKADLAGRAVSGDLTQRVEQLLATLDDDRADWRARRNASQALDRLSVDMARVLVVRQQVLDLDPRSPLLTEETP